MQRKLFFKLVMIAGLSLLLLIPLAMIHGQVADRQSMQAMVTRDIARSTAGEQTLIGPVLAVQYRERVLKIEKDPVTRQETRRHDIVERSLAYAPERLDISGDARVETRYRGIYHAQLYHLGLQIDGRASYPAHLGLPADTDLVDAELFLVLGVSDPRGIRNDPSITVNGQSHRFITGNANAFKSAGLRVPLGRADLANGGSFDFSLPLALTGSDHLAIAPVGDATQVSLRSSWPHPSFQGRFLPIEHRVNDQGFEARWQVSHLARNFENALSAGESSRHGDTNEALAISFIEPVNVYLKSERAVKYGVIFVVLTFAAFFLFEILRRLPIHPLQYLLVGLALASFFLLLIALSEHLDFAEAYALSATACVLLIGTYLSGVLRGWRLGSAFAGTLAALYGVLYGVLLSEDNALLMGALLIFCALGGIMLATRKLDWYRIGAAMTPAAREDA